MIKNIIAWPFKIIGCSLFALGMFLFFVSVWIRFDMKTVMAVADRVQKQCAVVSKDSAHTEIDKRGVK